MTEEEKIKARERSRKYYQAHKEEILAKQYLYKKKKYKEDEEYRKKVYENHRRYVEKNRDKVYSLKREWQIKNRGYSTKNEIIKDYKQRIDKAVEYNKEIKNKIEKQLDNGQSYDFIVAGYLAIFHDTLEEILRGEE